MTGSMESCNSLCSPLLIWWQLSNFWTIFSRVLLPFTYIASSTEWIRNWSISSSRGAFEGFHCESSLCLIIGISKGAVHFCGLSFLSGNSLPTPSHMHIQNVFSSKQNISCVLQKICTKYLSTPYPSHSASNFYFSLLQTLYNKLRINWHHH